MQCFIGQIIIAKPEWCSKMQAWSMDVGEKIEESTLAVQRMRNALKTSLQTRFDNGRQMLDDALYQSSHQTRLNLNVDLAFPTILFPARTYPDMETSDADAERTRSDASLAVVEMGRMSFTTQPNNGNVQCEVHLKHVNLGFCESVHWQEPTLRCNVFENSFSANVKVCLAVSDPAVEDCVGSSHPARTGCTVEVRVKVEPLEVPCLSLCVYAILLKAIHAHIIVFGENLSNLCDLPCVQRVCDGTDRSQNDRYGCHIRSCNEHYLSWTRLLLFLRCRVTRQGRAVLAADRRRVC